MINGEKFVVIVGLSGVGKSTYAKELANKFKGYKLIHTDEYLRYGDYGSKEALFNLMRDVSRESGKLIVEGSLCYRLLRTGLEMGSHLPNLVIHVGARASVRQIRRPNKDYSRTDMIYKKIWHDYTSMLKHSDKKPRIVEYDTTDLI